MNYKLLSGLLLAGYMSVFGYLLYVGSQQNFNPNLGLGSLGKNTMNSGPSKTAEEKFSKDSKIKKFKDFKELSDFLDKNLQSEGGRYLARNFAEETMPMMLEDSQAMDTSGIETEAAVGKSASDDFSKTNVQVEGVDEADIIKTDGKYIYALSNDNLFIVDARPAKDSEVLSAIKFESTPSNIYVNGDKLIVFGQDRQLYKKDIYKRFKRRSNYTFFKVFDLVDRKNPRQVRDLEFEGNYFNSRMIGDYIYFVTNNYSYNNYDDELPVPRILDGDSELIGKCKGDKCISPSVYYFDTAYNSYNFTTVSAVNVKDENENIFSEVYLMPGGQNMYVSAENIYLAYTKYLNRYELEAELLKNIVYPSLSPEDKSKVLTIESAASYVLTDSEKQNKISRIIEKHVSGMSDKEQDKLRDELEKEIVRKYDDISRSLEKTIIHKIKINVSEKEKLSYVGSAEVPGHILNQFSIDESDGKLRIATTKNRMPSWGKIESEKSSSNLFVFDKNLKQLGSIEGLAEDERIYSVRFMQNRAYLVTFKQTDPLFVIDLTDDANPKVLGELKIPGFSNYLHPFDENTLIGVGRDTEINEYGGVVTKGLKISLFDVQDVAKPREVAKYEMGDRSTDSIALRDHKAFLFSKEKNLLVIPVTDSGRSIFENSDGLKSLTNRFNGAAVFDITNSSIELRGRIEHPDSGRSRSDYWFGYRYYDNTVKRSLYIDSDLYTFSNKYLKINSLENLDEIKILKMEKEKSGDDFEIIN